MMLQLSAIAWAVIGIFSGSLVLFSLGGLACILIDIVKVSIKASNAWITVAAYLLGYSLLGSLSGVLLASIVSNLVEALLYTRKLRMQKLEACRTKLPVEQN